MWGSRLGVVLVGSVGSDGSLWVRLRVRVRLGGVGCTGRGEARGSRELCACAGQSNVMLCYDLCC